MEKMAAQKVQLTRSTHPRLDDRKQTAIKTTRLRFRIQNLCLARTARSETGVLHPGVGSSKP
jgi:hypothetical protein